MSHKSVTAARESRLPHTMWDECFVSGVCGPLPRSYLHAGVRAIRAICIRAAKIVVDSDLP